MKKVLQGNEAIARGAREAGVTVAAAYPGTPLSEIPAEIAKYPERDDEDIPRRFAGGGRTAEGASHDPLEERPYGPFPEEDPRAEHQGLR